jgi:hypothetical protein
MFPNSNIFSQNLNWCDVLVRNDLNLVNNKSTLAQHQGWWKIRKQQKDENVDKDWQNNNKE